MCKNTFKIPNIRMVKTLKGAVQNMYHNSYFLNCKQTPTAAAHLHFRDNVPVSPVVVYITADEYASQCSCWCIYTCMHMVTYITARNMNNFKSSDYFSRSKTF